MLFTSTHREELAAVGFTRIADVIPKDLVHCLLHSLKDVSHVNYDDAATWHVLPNEYPGVIPSHHHQSQWDIRQHPRLHEVFAELWATDELWVTMDRIGFIPPRRRHEKEECSLHWDTDPYGEPWYQAIVYLTDTDLERAPFGAAPSVFHNLDKWLEIHLAGVEFQSADFSKEDVVAVPGRAGDLIIWSSRLPHGPRPNLSSMPRVMQAVTMLPVAKAGWTREEQIEWWKTKRAPPWWRDVPGQMDPEPGDLAALTELGRRLIGLGKCLTTASNATR